MTHGEREVLGAAKSQVGSEEVDGCGAPSVRSGRSSPPSPRAARPVRPRAFAAPATGTRPPAGAGAAACGDTPRVLGRTGPAPCPPPAPVPPAPAAPRPPGRRAGGPVPWRRRPGRSRPGAARRPSPTAGRAVTPPARPRTGREVGISPQPNRRHAGSAQAAGTPSDPRPGRRRSRDRCGTGPVEAPRLHGPVTASSARPARGRRRRSAPRAAPRPPGRSRPARRGGAPDAAAPSSTA
ncbi:Uncharacterised protein [Mycobacterium tuberculosis]|nr:Uncharacterised protein [Mycobacterium tuberculosis]